MTNVLIVDDSPTLRHLIRAILTTDPELNVIGRSAKRRRGRKNGGQASSRRGYHGYSDADHGRLRGHSPDHVENPVPIVVLTSTESDIRLGATYKGVESGALMVFGKPNGLPGDDPEAVELINVVKAMADVKVIRRKWKVQEPPEAEQAKNTSRRSAKRYRIVAVGTSTGGPPALRTVLGELPATFPVPVMVVQHISKGFADGLARWLNETVALRVKLAEGGEPLLAGTAYIAPDGVHLQVSGQGKVALLKESPMDGHRPSVTALFNSVAKQYGPDAVGVLMTGMGRDGANGLYAMKQEGAYTIAQDEASSIVFGMPKEAINMGAASEVLALQKIGQKIKELIP
jgi:two-component system chemotaxis response regulator CheB